MCTEGVALQVQTKAVVLGLDRMLRGATQAVPGRAR